MEDREYVRRFWSAFARTLPCAAIALAMPLSLLLVPIPIQPAPRWWFVATVFAGLDVGLAIFSAWRWPPDKRVLLLWLLYLGISLASLRFFWLVGRAAMTHH